MHPRLRLRELRPLPLERRQPNDVGMLRQQPRRLLHRVRLEERGQRGRPRVDRRPRVKLHGLRREGCPQVHPEPIPVVDRSLPRVPVLASYLESPHDDRDQRRGYPRVERVGQELTQVRRPHAAHHGAEQLTRGAPLECGAPVGRTAARPRSPGPHVARDRARCQPEAVVGVWQAIVGKLVGRRADQDVFLDLRRLPTTTCRVRGLKYYLAEQQQDQYRTRGYLLVREPANDHDKDAIAVYDRGVKVGFVAASRAGFTAALLDQLNAPAYRIDGRPDGHGRVLIEMPTVPALRELVTARPRPA